VGAAVTRPNISKLKHSQALTHKIHVQNKCQIALQIYAPWPFFNTKVQQMKGRADCGCEDPYHGRRSTPLCPSPAKLPKKNIKVTRPHLSFFFTTQTTHSNIKSKTQTLTLVTSKFTVIMESHILHWLPNQCGLYLWIPNGNQWQKKYLPCSLTNIKVKASIVDMVSRVTLSQTFSNDNADGSYEALYRFPLYENSAVCGFEMEHSGRKIVGIVQAEEEAVKTYEKAKAEGKTAALVLQKEPDIFQTKVGNIPPKTSITVTLTYITPLKQDTESNAVRFTLPTAIAPRYGVPTNSGTSNVKTANTGFELTLDAKMPSQITSISSPSHPIAMSLSGSTSAGVTLSNTSPFLDKDIVILIAATDLDNPRCVIETHPTAASKCAMLTLVPKFNLPRVPTEVIFIIDRSGSMYDKVEVLRKALQIFLKSLPASPEIYFNICSFGSHFDYLFKDGKSQKYDAKTLKKAEDYVTKVDSNYGGTEILEPLLDSMKKRRTDCQTTIILLTDGEVYNTEAIVSSIAQEKSKHLDKPLRVFSLGIGNSVSHHLVEGIARAGGGYSQLVMMQERLDKKVVRMLSAGLQAPLKDLHVDWPGKPPIQEMVYNLVKGDPAEDFDIVAKEEKQSSTFFDKEADDLESMKANDPASEPPKATLKAPTIQQFPETISPLYNVSRHVMFLLFPSKQPTPQNVTLKGTAPDGTVMSLDVPVTEYAITDDSKPILHTLAARTLLGELQEGRLNVQTKNAEDNTLEDAVKQEGIRIGVKYGLASKWTGFVAVDETKPNKPEPTPQQESTRGTDMVHGLGSFNYECAIEEDSRDRFLSAPGGFAPQHTGFPSFFAGSAPHPPAPMARMGGVNLSSITAKSDTLSASNQALRGKPKSLSSSGGFGGFGAVGGLARSIGSAFGGSGRQQEKSVSSGMVVPTSTAPPPPPAARAPVRKRSSSKKMGKEESAGDDDEDMAFGLFEERAPPAKPAKVALSDEDKVFEIVMQQSSSGAFPSTLKLVQQMGFTSIADADAKRPATLKNIAAEVWMTALVCMFLEKKLASEKEAWELVVEKAWGYVSTALGADKVAELKKAAEGVIGA
jgi:von Willebrand factor A domain-containing protein 5